MGQNTEHPLPVYQRWFSQIPLAHRRRLALGYWLFTTENTADMAMSHNQALEKFQAYLSRPDFPLRLLSRMIIVRGMTTYLLSNWEILEQGKVFAKDQDNSNVVLDLWFWTLRPVTRAEANLTQSRADYQLSLADLMYAIGQRNVDLSPVVLE